MALNSSGPISLAGATVGQSIELELGGSGTTQISLNDTAVRNLAGVSVGAITIPINFWGKSSVTYWITNYTSANVAQGSSIYQWGFGVNSTGTPYCAIHKSGSGFNGSGIIFSVNKDTGAVISAVNTNPTVTGTTSPYYTAQCITFDTSNNLYVGGQWSATTSREYSTVTQYSSTLSILWTYYAAISAQDGQTFAVGINPVTGDIYRSIDNNNLLTYLQRLNSSKTPLSNAGVSPGSSAINAFTFDSSGNTYIACAIDWDATVDKGALFKLNSSGTAVQINSNATGPVFGGIENYNNSFLIISALITNGTGYAIMKTDFSFNQVWTKGLSAPRSGVTYKDTMRNLTIDSSGNTYVLYQTSTSVFVVAKWDSNGTLQWQRTITVSTITGCNYPSIQIDKTNNVLYIYLFATSGTLAGSLLFKLPTSGAGTGTYSVNGSTITYAISSYSEITPTIATTGGTATLTTQAIYTSGTPTYTTNSPTVTPSTVSV